MATCRLWSVEHETRSWFCRPIVQTTATSQHYSQLPPQPNTTATNHHCSKRPIKARTATNQSNEACQCQPMPSRRSYTIACRLRATFSSPAEKQCQQQQQHAKAHAALQSLQSTHSTLESTKHTQHARVFKAHTARQSLQRH